MKEIFSFSSKDFTKDPEKIDSFGMRGQNLMKLAEMRMPIPPGFLLTSDFLAEEAGKNEKACIEEFSRMSKDTGKEWNGKNPLLVKLVVSPMLNMVHTFSSIHNVGLCDATIEEFASFVGEFFAYHEYNGVLWHIMELEALTTTDLSRKKHLEKRIQECKKASDTAHFKKNIENIKKLYPVEIFEKATEQFYFVKNLFCMLFASSESLNDAAILIQAMTFGNYGDESYFGTFTTRDLISGKNVLSGTFFKNSFDDVTSDKSAEPIAKLDKRYLTELKDIAKKIETEHKEIRRIKFTIENGKLLIIDQSSVADKTAQADIQTILDLLKNKVIDEAYAINAIQPPRLAEILHPVLDAQAASNVPSITGGISGSIGAAVGRVFFSTSALMEAARISNRRNLDEQFILAMTATYAEDVKAIEASSGVISQEGGYSSHAPVVARSLGKVALVHPDIQFSGQKMKIGKYVVKEGDYVSMRVPSYGDPSIYFAPLPLKQPKIEQSGLLEYLEIVQKHLGDFSIYANADQPKDVKLAAKFLADGVGLCRTEHMFFNEKRILLFRSLIVESDSGERAKILAKLKKIQIADFYSIFSLMGEKSVIIRLLDAPLHEFLPHTKEKMDEFVSDYKKLYPKKTASEIRMRCDLLSESNPMFGHRGIRIAVTYPEIYHMQVEAIFEAAYKLRKEKNITCHPEVMIPIVMNAREVKTMRFGKRIEGRELKGIQRIEEELRKQKKEKPIPYKIGVMVELPAAALLADKIAFYADFFSFGTNDLTQTCLGLSRDDFNSFFSEYNELDLVSKNPFQYLQEPVKELIEMATLRGRLSRPDLRVGLCGEHGAEPSNLQFCIDLGLNYVSCSPYGIPVAKLASAQLLLKGKKTA